MIIDQLTIVNTGAIKHNIVFFFIYLSVCLSLSFSFSPTLFYYTNINYKI